MLKRLVFVLTIIAGITLSQATFSVAGPSQTATACMAVDDFPVDYRTIWPTAIKKYVEGSTSSPSGYMKGYIEVQKKLFKIKEKKAIAIYDAYAAFWVISEREWIANQGYQSSSKYISSLVKECKKYTKMRLP